MTIGGDFLQSAETAHAIVDMGHVIAGLQLKELFKGEGLVGIAKVADGIFVITFEDFVVGETNQLLRLVNKAMVELALQKLNLRDRVINGDTLPLGDGNNIHMRFGCGKDFFQTPLLLLVSNGDENLVAFVAIVAEGVDEHVKLFVESGLYHRLGLQLIGLAEIGAVALLDNAATQKRLDELVAGAIVLLIAPCIGKEGLEGFAHEHQPLHPHQVVATKIVEQGDFLLNGDHILLAALHVGQDTYLVVLLDGELTHGVESAEGIYLVIEKFNSVRMLIGVGEDIDNATTNSELPRLYHEVYPLEIVVLQHLHHMVHLHLSPFAETQGVAGEGTAGDNFLAQRLGIGDHQQVAATIELFDHLAALHDISVVGDKKISSFVFHLLAQPHGSGWTAVLAVGGREEQHTFLFQLGFSLIQ